MNKNIQKGLVSNTTPNLYPNLKKIALNMTNCSFESAAYSDCCLKKSLNLNQNDCLKEFEILRLCLKRIGSKI